MAMSRSIGGTWLTTVLPIRMSPDVMASRPAIMRSVVVLPQPEGPTKTTNSLSRMCRSTSFTTWLASNFLLSLRTITSAMTLSLDRAGEARNVVFDEERVDDRHRDRTEQRARHQRTPEEDVAADQLGGDADRHGLLVGRRQEDQGVDELVPRQGEGDDAGRQDAGHRHRDDDVDHGLPARGAVDARAFLELLGDGLEVAHHQPGTERDEERRIGQDQRPRRVAELEIADNLGERNEQQRLRHQVGDEDHGSQAAGPREVEPGQRIARQHAAEQRDDGRHEGDEHRVEHPAGERRFLEQVRDVLERRIVRPERLVADGVPRLVELAVRSEGRDDHPVEGKQQDEDEQDQRDVVEHPLPPKRTLNHQRVSTRRMYRSCTTTMMNRNGNMASEIAAPSDSNPVPMPS